MGIRPALGWLALLLFTTSAQAEGAHELLLGSPKAARAFATPPAASVTPKTKAAAVVLTGARSRPSLTVIESSTAPRADYEAEIYAGVSLDAQYAKERGLDKGLVTMVFEAQRRAAFRVAHDRIRRVVRLAGADSTPSLVRASTIAATRPKDHVDVLETDDGVIVVETSVLNAGMFVTSDVYAFAKNATLDQRIGALESLSQPARVRVREALVAAEWAPAPPRR